MSTVAAVPRGTSGSLRWLVLGAVAVMLMIAAQYALRGPGPAAAYVPLDPATLRPGFGPSTYTEAIERLDTAVEGKRALAEQHPTDWLPAESYARALMARYRLTAAPEDLAEADRQLTRALLLAPWPAGPSLTRASVSLTMHDLPAARSALARFDAQAVPAPADEQLEARSIRCEIAFERGELAEARKLCGSANELGLGLRQANLAAKTGDFSTAARLIEAQLRRGGLPPSSVAILALQRAALALAQGDWRASRRWSEAADRAFPGYWLSQAYLAQQDALDGNREAARQRYRALAGQTGNPDVLDALARLASADGRQAEADSWAAQAGAAWRQRSAVLPLAYAAHRAEHELLYGDAATALALAESDYRRRPYPAAISHYAYALWRTGNAARALEVVRLGQKRGFATADMKLIEGLALGSLGDAGKAGAAIQAARRLNPHIDDLRQQFVGFQQD